MSVSFKRSNVVGTIPALQQAYLRINNTFSVLNNCLYYANTMFLYCPTTSIGWWYSEFFHLTTLLFLYNALTASKLLTTKKDNIFIYM